MGRLKQFITEAIALDDVKKYLKGKPLWDYKNDLNDIFGDRYRIVIGTIEPDFDILDNHPLYNTLEKLFVDKGYILTKESYIKGYVTKGKQQFKIGKILKKWYDDGWLMPLGLDESFRDDPVRQQNRKPYKIIVSKHPYDVLGASTDRNWTSCVNLGGGIVYDKGKDKDKGMNADRLVNSLHTPFMVAYLVDPDDKNAKGKQEIRRPLSRILIYPFQAKNYPDVYNWSIGDVYGVGSNQFTGVVRNWVEELNEKFEIEDGLFQQIEDVYYDNFDMDLVKTWLSQEELIEDFENHTNHIDIQDGIIEEWEKNRNVPYLHGLQLKEFVEKEHTKHYLWSDIDFYNEFIIPFIQRRIEESSISDIFHSGEVDIWKIWDDGTIHFNKISVGKLPLQLEDRYEGDVDEIYSEYGPNYVLALILNELKQIDNVYDYIKGHFNDNLEKFYEKMSQVIGDALLQNSIDPEVKNWKQIKDFDEELLQNTAEELMDNVNMP